MAQVNINMKKVNEKWSPILDKMGVNESSKRAWMAEYAEYHQLTENVGYANLGNISGMGAVVSPVASQTPGQTGFGTGSVTGLTGSGYGNGGATGSGDYGQQLLPVAMKVAAHTIGLDLVSVKPSAGPVIDLMYVDYRYDDGAVNSDDYNPMYFKIDTNDNGVSISQLNAEIKAILTANGIRETTDGLTGRIFFTFAANPDALVNRAAGVVGVDPTIEPENKEGVIEFVGFSRIDGKPMFKTYRTTNAAPQGQWKFSKTKNTFGECETVVNAFELANSGASFIDDASEYQLGFGSAGLVSVELVSVLEDHLPAFTTNGLRHGMPRQVDENTYPGIIAPNVTTKRVQVGTVEVSSALKVTEIEDIKAQTGIDIVQKLESVLVNELSQTISKEIVSKIFQLGEENRKSAPGYATGTTKFDFDADAYFASGLAPGGETSQSAQRKLITKMKTASFYISQEGRVGPATFAVTNGNLAAVLTEGANYTIQPAQSSENGSGQMYPVGTVNGITVYVDPYMKYDDDRIVLGRKNNPDEPGVIFVPYLMAQSINLISEATFAPRMLLRSRYAVTEVGFHPQKQYMSIRVTDTNGYLS